MSGFGGVAQLRIDTGSAISPDSASEDDRTLDSPESPESPPSMLPARATRSVSLGSSLKKPDRRGDKKAVHFADSLGLDLVNVHPLYSSGYDSFDDLFGSTPPLYFNGFHEFYRHQRNHQATAPPFIRNTSLPAPKVTNARSLYLHTHFVTLGSCEWREDGKLTEKLIKKTRSNGVCLKSVNTVGTSLSGTIAVSNIDYKKEVWIRYTMDKWRSHADLPALYVSGSKQPDIDMFSFSLFLPQSIPIGAMCEFCIRYLCGGKEYWDNNGGANYVVECRSLNDDDGIKLV